MNIHLPYLISFFKQYQIIQSMKAIWFLFHVIEFLEEAMAYSPPHFSSTTELVRENLEAVKVNLLSVLAFLLSY